MLTTYTRISGRRRFLRYFRFLLDTHAGRRQHAYHALVADDHIIIFIFDIVATSGDFLHLQRRRRASECFASSSSQYERFLLLWVYALY